MSGRSGTRAVTAAIMTLLAMAALVGCSGGEPWEAAEIAGVRLSEDRKIITVIPAQHYSPSCRDTRARVETVDGKPVVHYETRSTASDCTLEGGSPLGSTVNVTMRSPVGSDLTAAQPEPTPYSDPRLDSEELRQNRQWVTGLRSESGIGTQPPDDLWTSPDFVRNWEQGGLPLTDAEMDTGIGHFGRYPGMIQRLIESADLDSYLVEISTDTEPGAITVVIVADEDRAVAGEIAAIWEPETICGTSLRGECVEMISTHILQDRVRIEAVTPAMLTAEQRCLAVTSPVYVSDRGMWTQLHRTLEAVLTTASVQLADPDRASAEMQDTLRAAAAQIQDIELPLIWEDPAPWETDEITTAWTFIRRQARNCDVPLPEI